MTALVEARQLSYDVGDTRLLDRVSLEAAAGEVVGIVGPNSAGKSTLLRLLAGDLMPSAGTVIIGGETIQNIPLVDLALRRSFLRQHPTTEVPFTVREVVAMGRHPHRMRPANSAHDDTIAVDNALGLTDVAHLRDRVFATLSGGEEQRTNVARILAQEAPVALLDEPTAALDIGHQEMVMRSLGSVAARGGAVVTVLHDLNLAAAFAHHLILLNGGAVVAAGAPRVVLREEVLTEIYGHPVRVIDHPFRPGPLVLPIQD